MKKTLKILVWSCFLWQTGGVLANPPTPKPSSNPKHQQPPTAVDDQATHFTVQCPAPQQLRIKKGLWFYGSHWKSFEQTFSTRLTKFLGAQWNGQGTDIGQVICLYSNKNAQSFATQLFFDTVVPRPLSGAWHAPRSDRSGNVLNCAYSTPDSCSFPVTIQAKSNESIYQQAEQLQKAHPDNDNGDPN